MPPDVRALSFASFADTVFYFATMSLMLIPLPPAIDAFGFFFSSSGAFFIDSCVISIVIIDMSAGCWLFAAAARRSC